MSCCSFVLKGYIQTELNCPWLRGSAQVQTLYRLDTRDIGFRIRAGIFCEQPKICSGKINPYCGELCFGADAGRQGITDVQRLQPDERTVLQEPAVLIGCIA